MLFLDTSALVKRYIDEVGADLVLRRTGEDTLWAVSAVARPEAEIVLCRLGFDPGDPEGPWSSLRDDWDRCFVVPLDTDCLARAAEIGCRLGVRTLDALHLAAADRLPRPLTVLTFDRRLAEAA